MKIKNLPLDERPRERLDKEGEQSLSTAELLAVLLGSGTQGKSVLTLAHELLAHYGSLGALIRAGLNDLCQHKGLGRVKAIQLKAALGLASRLATEQPKVPITTARQAYLWIRDRIAHQRKEVFGVLLQDVKGHPIRWEIISIGTLTQTLVHPREVFAAAIEHRAASLILAHNHPSQDPTPSIQDIQLTQNLVRASQIIGIPINDHLIVTNTSYISFKERDIISFIVD